MNNEKIIKQAEKQVLCQIFCDNTLYHLNAALLRPELFNHKNHRHIYKLVVEIIQAGKSPDVLSIADKIGTDNAIEELADFFGDISTETPFLTLLLILNEHHKAKSLLALSNSIKIKLSADEDIFDIISFTQSELSEISSVTSHEDIIMSRHIDELNRNIEANASGKGKSGVQTGISLYDKFTGGHQPGDLIIFAGRTSMGKTSLAVTMLRNHGVRFQDPCGFLSLEMSCLQLTSRLAAMETGINSKHLLQGHLNSLEIQTLNSGITGLYNSKIFIDPCRNSSLDYLLSSCHYLASVHKVRVIYIDYLQLIKYNVKGKNQEQSIADICKALKSKAKELDIPIVLLSQLSRATEHNADKRPQLSNLRDSGQIEEAADVVAFVYREEYYKKDDESLKGLAEIIIAKGRNIGIATINARFTHTITEFSDLNQNEYLKPNYNENVF